MTPEYAEKFAVCSFYEQFPRSGVAAMKQDWHPDELAQHWTLSTDERELLGNRSGATRLSFAILLKSFQLEGRFPDSREEVAASVVTHLAIQVGVPPGAFNEGDWSERTQRYQRQYCSSPATATATQPASTLVRPDM
jgi:Domain of unknown function (DUF4158)